MRRSGSSFRSLPEPAELTTGAIRERLLEMSDLGHHYSYSILDSPLPVANYRATLRLRRLPRVLHDSPASVLLLDPPHVGDR